MSKKVFISAGHGGSDSGSVGNGFKEKDLNLSIAMACGNYLKSKGIEVLMSRTKDEDDDINQEARESNAFGPDLTVSIHNNAGGGDGAEAWYSIAGGVGKTCAENILAEIVKIGQNSRGAKTRKGANGRDYYGFIRQTKAPAVIVECAFIDNATDIQIVDTEPERIAMGEAIARGILKTLGVEDSAPSITPPAPQPTPVVNSDIKAGSTVKIAEGATYYDGKKVPAWVVKKNWIVSEVKGDRAVIDKSTDGQNSINSPINAKFLAIAEATAAPAQPTNTFNPYRVKVTAAALNIRQGAGTNFGITGCIRDRGVYTIVAESAGTGSDRGWGKLKSGAGWISLDFVNKL